MKKTLQSGVFLNGFPGFTYGVNATNTLNVSVLDNQVCLAEVELALDLDFVIPPMTVTSTSSSTTTGAVTTTTGPATTTGHASTSDDSDIFDSSTQLPVWGIVLIVAGSACVVCLLVSVVAGTSLLVVRRANTRRDLYKGRAMLTPTFSTMSLNEDGRYQGTVKQMDVENIEVLERIGKGSYGEVFKGRWKGTEVAIKKLPYYFTELDDEGDQDAFFNHFLKEAELMQSLRHPNIVQLLATFTSPDLCIVMEFMAKGSLFQLLQKSKRAEARGAPPDVWEIGWDRMRNMMLDAAKGMTYLHNSNPSIVHRDLKSHNLLVDEYYRVKVSDFGLSRMVVEDSPAAQTMTSCGTPSWTAPEVLRGEKYSSACDVYSMAIVLWECVTRSVPYEGIPHFQVVFTVGNQGMRPEIPPDCPHAWANLIVDCWAENPDDRPSFDDIINRLRRF